MFYLCIWSIWWLIICTENRGYRFIIFSKIGPEVQATLITLITNSRVEWKRISFIKINKRVGNSRLWNEILLVCYSCKYLDRGSRPPPPPPLRFVRGGSCVEAWWVGEGVQRLFSTYHYQFVSGSLRSPVIYNHITYIHTSKFNIQYGTVILSLYFPYPYYEKNPTSHPLLSWKGNFIIFFPRITRFYTI